MVDRYQRHLFHYRSANGKPLTFRSQIAALTDAAGVLQVAGAYECAFVESGE